MNKRSSGSIGSARLSLVPQRVQKSGRESTGKTTNRMSTGSRPSFDSRQSLASGRASVAGARRPLTAVNPGGPAKKRNRYSSSKSYGHTVKDPRPINDRGYKDQCVRSLVEFLAAHGYSHSINPKILTSPQTKDFVRIFEFLMSLLIPKYRIVTKMEEEIPKVLRLLGYPFSISKSAMYTVGTPHTWPTLLAALTWLMDQIQFTIDQNPKVETDIMFPPEDDFDGFSERKLKFDHCEEAYHRFLNFQDDYSDLEEKLAKQIKQNSAGGELEHLSLQNRQLREELEMLQQQADPLLSVKEQVTTMQLDKQKLATYIDQLEQHCRKHENKLKMSDEENINLEAEIEALRIDNSKKQQIYESQEFSQEDIQRVKMERQELTKQTETVEQEGQTLDKQVWQAEMAVSKIHDKTAATLTEYNRTAESLHLIPQSAENAFGIDYELKPAFSDMQMDRCNSIIKPALTQIKQETGSRIMEAVERKTNEQETLEHYNDMIQEKEEAMKALETTMKRTEDEIQSRKELKLREIQHSQSETDALHHEIQEIRQCAQMGLLNADRQLKDDMIKMQDKQAARKREEQRRSDFLLKAVDNIANHKHAIQEHTHKVAVLSEKNLEAAVRKYS